MSNFVNGLPQVLESQSDHVETVNELVAAGSPALTFGVNPETTVGLTWGILEGNFPVSGTPTFFANQSVTLTNTATNYLYLTSAGVLTKVTTAPSGWPGPLASSAVALYDITVASSLVTGFHDWRTMFGVSGGGGGSGTVTNTGGNLTANAVVLGAGTVDTKVAPGIVTDGTSALTLGVAGSSVGSVALKNATSGSITVQPPTGALGSSVLTLPIATDTLVGKATTDTLTNKTLTAPTMTAPVLGTPASGNLSNCTALPVGSLTGLGSGVATFLATPTSADLAAALTDETGSGAAVFATSPTLVTPVLGTPSSGNLSSCTADGTNAVGFRNIPQNSQSAGYTTVLADAGKHLLHPSADTTARTFTIDSNANVAFPIGTANTFINQNGGGVITLAITADTMRLAGAGTTGSRTLAANGICTAVKVTSTEWIVSGVNIT